MERAELKQKLEQIQSDHPHYFADQPEVQDLTNNQWINLARPFIWHQEIKAEEVEVWTDTWYGKIMLIYNDGIYLGQKEVYSENFEYMALNSYWSEPVKLLKLVNTLT
jgi:hypothetical protein